MGGERGGRGGNRVQIDSSDDHVDKICQGLVAFRLVKHPWPLFDEVVPNQSVERRCFRSTTPPVMEARSHWWLASPNTRFNNIIASISLLYKVWVKNRIPQMSMPPITFTPNLS